ncbi:hypothetical protein [Neobacillus sp. YIM B06451]|nr:hypothetical protein [Neobacillus sp. YIM B06451]
MCLRSFEQEEIYKENRRLQKKLNGKKFKDKKAAVEEKDLR